MREVEGEEHPRPHSPARDEHKVSGGDGPRARHAGPPPGRRDALRMGAAGRGARAEAALAYLLVIVASSRSCASATQQNSLRCSAGRDRT